MRDVTWTKAQEKCLQDQVINADQPGPVLKDFDLILEYVGTKGVKSAGKYNLLPLSCIQELGPLLSRPFTLDLKRPQLRSHPYLQGLNLLLRASGLGRAEGSGAKARLVLDPVMLEQWNRLNPTERYFNLLEAWWRLGRPEMVGEKGGSHEPMLITCTRTWERLLEIHQWLKSKHNPYSYFPGIGRDFYQVALLDLFGIIVIKQPAREVIERWIPADIGPAPFGDAILTLLATKANIWEEYLSGGGEDEQTGGLEVPRFGVWQPLFQPYFPEWRENLVFPKREPREGTFLFKVSLGATWRRIAMPADSTLDELVDWILRSVDFDSDHLYEFTYRDQLGTKVSVHDPRVGESPFADEVLIGTLPLDPGETMNLTYDFGDNWQFTVMLEQVDPPAPKAKAKSKAPRIVERHGKAPEQYPSWDE